jgi:predicted enzyme related to lactoylglutathione lyase
MALVKKVDLSWITVSDLNKAKKFYVDILGFKLESHEPKYGWMELIGVDGGMRLGIAQTQQQEKEGCAEKPGSNAIVTCVVDNIDKAIKELTPKGVKFHGSVIEVPGHVKMITFTDPDDNKFQLVEVLSKK